LELMVLKIFRLTERMGKIKEFWNKALSYFIANGIVLICIMTGIKIKKDSP